MDNDTNPITPIYLLDKPHKVSFTHEISETEKVKGQYYIFGLTDLSDDEDNPDYVFIISHDKKDEEYFPIRLEDITTKIKMQSGDFVDVEDFLDWDFVDAVNAKKYNKKKTQQVQSPQNVLWQGKPFDFSYPYDSGLRTLRLDAISVNVKQGHIYWKCFCYMRKATRTFKQATFGNTLIVDGKEYSMKDFYKLFLKIDADTGEVLT